jgi:hypothetical protein
MDHLRRHATAGAVLVATGIIVATPVVAPQLTGVRAHDVTLTAGSGDSFDLTPFEDVFNTTADNAQTVYSAAGEALNTLFNGMAAAVANGTFFDKLPTVLEAVSLTGAPDELVQHVVTHTLGGSGLTFPDPSSVEQEPDAGTEVHLRLYEGLIGATPSEYQPDESTAELLTAVTNFLASPLSGVVTGLISPAISPWVALFNSLEDGDLSNIPANVVNGFFNGATLNLDDLAPLVNQVLLAQDETEQLTGLSIGFGGLFSPGNVVLGPGDVVTGVAQANNGVGGSLLNTFGFDEDVHEPQDPEAGTGFLGTTEEFGVGLGPIAGLAGLEDLIGHIFAGDLSSEPSGLDLVSGL